uniref:Antitoxin n=1 Tax=Candidatus Kentrum sp. FW TaxID=2126338 RepID=A0A450U3D1_9GAMM|nr:MAG: prevent-host-death family protein [Candidatus Kentron sp. FW]
MITLSSRDFNQHTSHAKKASRDGAVFITERGRPAHVLLSIEDYRKLTGNRITLLDALAQSDAPDFDFDPPRADALFRPADLS